MSANKRRQAIWHTLCSQRHVKMSYLVELYGVSRTTIRKDIEILSLSYPLITSNGYNGGVSLPDWYVPDPAVLSPHQLDLLVRLSKTLDGDDAKIMESIIAELSSHT